MYNNAMPAKSDRTSLVAIADAEKFRRKLREWRKKNPNCSDHEMPGWLVALKVKADNSAADNLGTKAAKSAMDLFPPMR